MKGILLDENLPASIRLPTTLPVSHVSEISSSLSDTEIWRHAAHHSLVIVTKDADFSHRILSSEPPPWIIHVRFGNQRIRAFSERISAIWPAVEALLPKHKLISLLTDRIEAVE